MCLKQNKFGWDGIGQPDIFVTLVKVYPLLVRLQGSDVQDNRLASAAQRDDAGRLLVGREVHVLALHGFEALAANRGGGLRGRAMIERGRGDHRLPLDLVGCGMVVEGADLAGSHLKALLLRLGVDLLKIRHADMPPGATPPAQGREQVIALGIGRFLMEVFG